MMDEQAIEKVVTDLRAEIAAIQERNRLGRGLLNRRETAKLLGVSERTLRRMELSGKITAVRVGALVRYRQVELDRIMEGGAA